MDRETFETGLRRDGYQIVYGGLRGNETIPEHVHAWHARVFVLGGEITLTRDGKAERFAAGDWCEVAANTPHAEQVGPAGVAYIAGRRDAD